MNPDDNPTLRWKKYPHGQWGAERITWDTGEPVEVLGWISDQEYFRLKLAGKLDLELNRLFVNAMFEYITKYPE